MVEKQPTPHYSEISKQYSLISFPFSRRRISLIRLVDFCLLSSEAKKIFQQKKYNFFREAEHTVCLEFSIGDELFFIKRFFNEEKKVLFGKDINKLEQYTEKELSIILGDKLFPTNTNDITIQGNRFRTLMNFFIKDDLDNLKRIEPTNFFSYSPKVKEKSVYNLYLLNLPTKNIIKFDDLYKQYEKNYDTVKNLKQKVVSDTGKSIEEFKSDKILIESKIERLEHSIKHYDFLENYKDIESQLVDITSTIREELGVYHTLENRLKKIEESYNTNSTKIDVTEVQKLYNEVKSAFGDLVKRKIDEVIEFENQIIENRKKFLLKRENELKQESKKVFQQITVLEEKRSRLYLKLKEHGALESIENAYEQLILEKSNLNKTVQSIEQIDDIEEELAKLDVDISQVRLAISNDIRSFENKINELRKLFQQILSETIYLESDKGGAYFDITVSSNSKKNTLPFQIKVEIPKADALGQSRLKLIAYDYMVFINSLKDNRAFPKFLVHDGVFHGISYDSVVKSLNYMYNQYNKFKNFQYLLTFNEDEISKTNGLTETNFIFEFDERIILELSDDKDRMLFNKAFT